MRIFNRFHICIAYNRQINRHKISAVILYDWLCIYSYRYSYLHLHHRRVPLRFQHRIYGNRIFSLVRLQPFFIQLYLQCKGIVFQIYNQTSSNTACAIPGIGFPCLLEVGDTTSLLLQTELFSAYLSSSFSEYANTEPNLHSCSLSCRC